jgi:hypothetical protein
MVIPHGFCSLDVVLLALASWIFFWIAKPVANLLFDFLELESSFKTYMDEVIVALLKKFLQITRASVFGDADLDLKAKVSVNGSCIADFFISFSFNKCWDFVQGEILQPLWDIIADTNEEKKTGMVSERERWKIADKASGIGGSAGGIAGDAHEEGACWTESGDAREAMEAAGLRIDSRGPISLFDDVSVVLHVSEVSVDYVGRCNSLRRAVLGWVAVVFYTAVLGYDKGLVIK